MANWQGKSNIEPPSPPSAVNSGNGQSGEDVSHGTLSSTAVNDHAAAVNEDRDGASDDTSFDDHVKEVPAPKSKMTKRQKLKRHCHRFWLWYLIGFIIFNAIFLPIM